MRVIWLFALLLLAGCSGSNATPVAENPLLKNGVSKIQVYRWIDKASSALDQRQRGISKMCRQYHIKRAKAAGLPDRARKAIEAELSESAGKCSEYVKRLAPLVSRVSGIHVVPADLRTLEVWRKYNRGRVAYTVKGSRQDRASGQKPGSEDTKGKSDEALTIWGW